LSIAPLGEESLVRVDARGAQRLDTDAGALRSLVCVRVGAAARVFLPHVGRCRRSGARRRLQSKVDLLLQAALVSRRGTLAPCASAYLRRRWISFSCLARRQSVRRALRLADPPL